MPISRQIRSKVVDALSGQRVVFLHVPKCAGTSVSRALRLRYLLSYGGFQSDPIYRALETLYPNEDYASIVRRVTAFREIQLLEYLFQDIRCISGHVRYSNLAFETFGNNYRFITTLRDPVSLMISSYYYNSEVDVDRWQVDSDFESFLKSDRAKFLGSIYSSFFSGLSPDSDAWSSESIEQAKCNLRNFAVVGFVDDLRGFRRLLREALGIRLLMGHKNQSRGPAQVRRSPIPADVRRQIEALSAPNTEIYEFARTEFAANVPA